jgi:hypothetical protein
VARVLSVFLALSGLIFPSIGTALITEIIDRTGDGGGNFLDTPVGIALDGPGSGSGPNTGELT